MRPWKLVVSAVAMITGSAFFSVPAALSAPAAMAASPVLYVNGAAANCSDSGSGTQAVPFCSIQAAANVVVAGQTVQIQAIPNSAPYDAVTIRHSGTASAPITFVGIDANGPLPVIQAKASVPSVTVAGASYVVLSSLDIVHHAQDGVDLAGAHHVTLDRLSINEGGVTAGTPSGVAIDGKSSAITVSRSQIDEQFEFGYGIAVQAGAQQITISTNFVYSDSQHGGISIDGGTAGTTADVTSNSVSAVCGGALNVTGISSVVVENNFLGTDPVSGCSGPAAALSVATQSAPGVQADYNALHASGPGVEYIWSGVSYQTAATFTSGTGQGSHDRDMPSTVPSTDPPVAGSVLIDSADCGAPGELTTDLYGLPHVDDPLVADTGTGSCHADRGAVELQDPIVVSFGHAGASLGIVPFAITITMTSKASSPWNEPVSYSVDFGDGSAPQSVSASGSVTHTYTTPGPYQLAVTGTDTGGSSVTSELHVVAGTVSPPSDGLTAGPDVFTTPKYPGLVVVSANFLVTPGPDSWEVANTAIEFGDGTSTEVAPLASWSHMYPRPGTYTATLITTDLFGRTSTTKARISVGNEFIPIGPYVDSVNSDFAIGPHHALVLSAAQLNAGTFASAAAQLVVSVANPSGTGSLTVYPDGSSRPAQGDLDFARGQAASGVVLAVPGSDGKVAFYNNSSSTVAVAVTTTGIEVTGNGTSGQDGDTYVPVGPTRVLDTRQPVHHPVGAGQKVTFSVGAAGVPAAADQVLLDVTATNTQAAGSATVFSGTPNVSRPPPPSPSWAAGQTVTSLLAVPLSGTKVTLLNSSKGNADFMVDVVGYYNLYGTGAVYLPAIKQLTSSHGGPTVTLGGGSSVQVPVSGCLGAQVANITAITAKVEVTGTSANGFLLAYPPAIARPGTRTLTYTGRGASAGMAVIPVSSGAIELYNGGSGAINVGVRMTGCYYHYP